MDATEPVDRTLNVAMTALRAVSVRKECIRMAVAVLMLHNVRASTTALGGFISRVCI